MNLAFLIANLSNSGGTQRILTHLCNLLINEFNIIVLVNEEGKPFFPLNQKVKIMKEIAIIGLGKGEKL
jgi:hypothetical protein